MFVPNVQPSLRTQLTSLEVQENSKKSYKRKQTSTFKRDVVFRAEPLPTRSFFSVVIQWPLRER